MTSVFERKQTLKTKYETKPRIYLMAHRNSLIWCYRTSGAGYFCLLFEKDIY